MPSVMPNPKSHSATSHTLEQHSIRTPTPSSLVVLPRRRLSRQLRQRFPVRSARHAAFSHDRRYVLRRGHVERRILHLHPFRNHLFPGDMRYFLGVALLNGNLAAVG